jgi:hypothetical protein
VDVVGCSGYPEPRVFLESQGWWKRTPGATGTDFGHVHAATCFPWAQRVAGTVAFDVRVVLHDNPGILRHVQILVAGKSGSSLAGRVSPNARCEVSTCTFWYRILANTTVSPYDGRQEFRIQTHVEEPDGKRMFATTGWQSYLANGKPVADYRSSDNFTEGRGWYTEAEYTNASLRSAVPVLPVSGTWSVSVVLDRGSPGAPVTSHSVHLNPNFHAGDAGVVLKRGTGPFRGALSIDTTRLANGGHRLVLKSDSAMANGSTLSGIQVIPFAVAN